VAGHHRNAASHEIEGGRICQKQRRRVGSDRSATELIAELEAKKAALQPEIKA
jgi:hypothetical protein